MIVIQCTYVAHSRRKKKQMCYLQILVTLCINILYINITDVTYTVFITAGESRKIKSDSMIRLIEGLICKVNPSINRLPRGELNGRT